MTNDEIPKPEGNDKPEARNAGRLIPGFDVSGLIRHWVFRHSSFQNLTHL